jgi:hypothetical protein
LTVGAVDDLVRRTAFALPVPIEADAERPELLWLAAGGAYLRAEFCTPTVLLCSPDHANAWAARQAARLWAGAACARETARLGTA